MKITSQSTCGTIVHIEDNGRIQIARMTYEKKGRTSIRHIMESGKNGQTILQTLTEGVLKEGAKDRMDFPMSLLSLEPILIEFSNDEKNPGGIHIKTAFPVFVSEDKLRDVEAKDGDNHDELHGPITMVDINDLLYETEGKTVPFHYRVTRSVLVWAATNPKVLDHYYSLIASWIPTSLTDEQRAAIEAYPGKW
ncbi:MAG: hypothetical protein UV53_C0030G0003 [Candidatus Azambacteria bacterium GW2011_GWE1_42_9]|nr:MAG: hypothetical protein UV53_C0030G0003 [Candidatus Azambacteria bacterium GW2011_GWE1_42_9]